jgi:hypothetical protein
MSSSAALSCVKHGLVTVLAALERAATADHRGDMVEARALYTAACDTADTLIPALPPEHGSALLRRVTVARQRADDLREMESRFSAISSADVAEDTPLQLQPIAVPSPDVWHPDAADVTPPPSPLQRPFWLMRRLAATMQGTAWVTPAVRVDKAVWLQPGGTAVLRCLSPKIQLLMTLCECLTELSVATVADPAGLIVALNTFVLAADAATVAFAAEVGHGGNVEPASRVERGVRNLLHRGRNVLKAWNQQQEASQSTYVAWAVSFMTNALAIERWIAHFATSPDDGHGAAVNAALHRVAVLLLRAPCRFLLQDMWRLVERHAATQRNICGRIRITQATT